VGLLVNLISALLLKDGHTHHHHDHHGDAHGHHHDHTLRAAYMHVLADALTSILAIVALILGKYLGWLWLDPMMGIVGAVIITRWSIGLLKETSPILLDASMEPSYVEAIKTAIESKDDNRISDLHVWQVDANHHAAIIAIVTHVPQASAYYKTLLHDFHQLSHITIEINICDDPDCDKAS